VEMYAGDFILVTSSLTATIRVGKGYKNMCKYCVAQ